MPISIKDNSNFSDPQKPFKPNSISQTEEQGLYVLESDYADQDLAITYELGERGVDIVDISGEGYSDGDIFQLAENAEIGGIVDQDADLVGQVERYLDR